MVAFKRSEVRRLITADEVRCSHLIAKRYQEIPGASQLIGTEDNLTERFSIIRFDRTQVAWCCLQAFEKCSPSTKTNVFSPSHTAVNSFPHVVKIFPMCSEVLITRLILLPIGIQLMLKFSSDPTVDRSFQTVENFLPESLWLVTSPFPQLIQLRLAVTVSPKTFRLKAKSNKLFKMIKKLVIFVTIYIVIHIVLYIYIA